MNHELTPNFIYYLYLNCPPRNTSVSINTFSHLYSKSTHQFIGLLDPMVRAKPTDEKGMIIVYRAEVKDKLIPIVTTIPGNLFSGSNNVNPHITRLLQIAILFGLHEFKIKNYTFPIEYRNVVDSKPPVSHDRYIRRHAIISQVHSKVYASPPLDVMEKMIHKGGLILDKYNCRSEFDIGQARLVCTTRKRYLKPATKLYALGYKHLLNQTKAHKLNHVLSTLNQDNPWVEYDGYVYEGYE